MAATLLWSLLAFAACSLALYTALLAPRRLEVTKHDIPSPELPEGFDGTTVVQFSDTHLGYFHSLGRFERLVAEINAQRPDLVVFTGDLFDGRAMPEGDPAAIPLLARIRAPLGKFAVCGNHDFGRDRRTRTADAFLAAGGFDVLVNETRRIEGPDGSCITVTGIDDYNRGTPDPHGALSSLPEQGWHLLLVHAPDPAIHHLRYPIDLQLSGHSHGGQVSLPLVGAIIRTSGGRRYVRGLKRFDHRPARPGRSFLLYVNRGIGMTRLPFRFGSVPELTVLTLRRTRAGES